MEKLMNHIDQKNELNILYKYRKFDEKGFHLRTLSHNEFYFATNKELNDPFDLNLHPNLKDATLDGVTKYFKYMFKNNKINFIEHVVSWRIFQIKNQFLNDRKGFDLFIRERLEEFNNNIGVCSFSLGKYNHPLMWSHYSDSHFGFCVGINFNKFDSCIKQLLKTFYNEFSDFDFYFSPVVYKSKYPNLDLFKLKNKYFHVLYKSKFNVWKYEKEYRFISTNINNNQFINSPDNKIHFHNQIIILHDDLFEEVIVGIKTKDEDIQKIINILKTKEKKIPLYRMYQKDDHFELEKEEIDY